MIDDKLLRKIDPEIKITTPWPEKGYSYPILIALGDDGEGYMLSVPEQINHEEILVSRWLSDSDFSELPEEPGIFRALDGRHRGQR